MICAWVNLSRPAIPVALLLATIATMAGSLLSLFLADGLMLRRKP